MKSPVRRPIPPQFLWKGEGHGSSFQSETDEILRKRDLVALREMLKNWSPPALVRVMTELASEDQMIAKKASGIIA